MLDKDSDHIPPEHAKIGTVLVFKNGVTEQQAREALNGLSELLEKSFIPEDAKWGEPLRVVSYRLHEFNGQYGGPTWYIP